MKRKERIVERQKKVWETSKRPKRKLSKETVRMVKDGRSRGRRKMSKMKIKGREREKRERGIEQMKERTEKKKKDKGRIKRKE